MVLMIFLAKQSFFYTLFGRVHHNSMLKKCSSTSSENLKVALKTQSKEVWLNIA